MDLVVRREAREDSEQEPVFQRPWLVWAACGCWCAWKPEGDSDSPGLEEETLARTGVVALERTWEEVLRFQICFDSGTGRTCRGVSVGWERKPR